MNPPSGSKARVATLCRTAMLYCPFPGCPNMLVAQSADSLTKHLSKVHLKSDQTIPLELLVSLRQSACTPCGQLYPTAGTCMGCGVSATAWAGHAPMDVDEATSTTTGVLLGNQLPVVAAADTVPLARSRAWSSLDGMEPAGLTPPLGKCSNTQLPRCDTFQVQPSAQCQTFWKHSFRS